MADSGKKRKRNADGSSKHSKKVAVEAPAVASVTVFAIANEDDWAPVIVSTPGLGLQEDLSLQPYARKRKTAAARPSHNVSARELLLQSSEHASMDYVGREEETNGVDGLLKHYVGVYDPTSGNLQIMESRKMTVRGIVRSQQADAEAYKGKEDYVSMRDLRNELGQTFGTKKARKAIASITENAIAPASMLQRNGSKPKLDAVSSTLLANFADVTKDMQTKDQLQAVADEGKPRPKADLSAEHVNDVYTPASLIGHDILKLLPVKEWQDAVKAKKEITTKSQFVAHRIQRLSADVQKLRILRYLQCVVDFFRASKSKGSRGRALPMKRELQAALPGVPEAVVESLKRKFSEGGGQMTKFHVDLLMTTICVLALIVDNFIVDTHDLKQDMGWESKELKVYFGEVGAKVSPPGEADQKRNGWDKAAASQHLFAKLKLPLEFPKVKYQRARK